MTATPRGDAYLLGNRSAVDAAVRFVDELAADTQALLLLAGEMTADEKRTVRAVLAYVSRRISSLRVEDDAEKPK